jgi:hypothetical protein
MARITVSGWFCPLLSNHICFSFFSIFLFSFSFLFNAHLPGFRQQLRSALGTLHNDGSFLPRFLSTDPFDLPLAAFAQKVETDAVTLLGVDQVVQSIPEPNKIHLVEVTLEDAILHPLAEVLQGFEDSTSAFVIRNIVGNHNEHNHNPISSIFNDRRVLRTNNRRAERALRFSFTYVFRGTGIPRSRQIFTTNQSFTSRYLGTVEVLFVSG